MQIVLVVATVLVLSYFAYNHLVKQGTQPLPGEDIIPALLLPIQLFFRKQRSS